MRMATVGMAIALLLAGCGRTVAPTVSVAPPRALAPASQALKAPVAPVATTPAVTVVDAATAKPEAPAAAGVTEATQWATMQAIARKGGLVTGLSSLTAEAPSGYATQLLPETTQAKAEALARAWASDARQAYIGWGFWKVSALGRVRHTYYSPSKQRVLKLEYSVTSGFLKQYEDVADGYDLAFLVLRDAYDVNAFRVKDAHERARSYGYRPGKNTTASLLNFVFLGPVWCFIDDRTWEPTVLVKAESGDVVTSGPLMWAASYLIAQAAKQ